MIVDDISSHKAHELVKALSGEFLEKSVRFARTAYSVNDLIALVELVHHLLDRVNIVL